MTLCSKQLFRVICSVSILCSSQPAHTCINVLFFVSTCTQGVQIGVQIVTVFFHHRRQFAAAVAEHGTPGPYSLLTFCVLVYITMTSRCIDSAYCDDGDGSAAVC